MGILPSTLRPFPSLEALPDTDLSALSRVLKNTEFRSGAQICREGAKADTCFFLVEGEVEVATQLSDGRRIFLATLGPGTIFGQAALTPGRLRSADIRASSNVQVLSLNRRDHQWALERSTTWAIHLQKLICIHVIRQLRSALGHLRELAVPRPSTSPQSPRTSQTKPTGAGRTSSQEPPVVSDDPLREGHDATTTGRLLTLIGETEATLAGEGVDLGSVQFVVDSDAGRRLHRRKP